MLTGLLLTAFLMGLGGIPHCTAMCGAACAATGRHSSRRLQLEQATLKASIFMGMGSRRSPAGRRRASCGAVSDVGALGFSMRSLKR